MIKPKVIVAPGTASGYFFSDASTRSAAGLPNGLAAKSVRISEARLSTSRANTSVDYVVPRSRNSREYAVRTSNAFS